jgi:hypothetical protein
MKPALLLLWFLLPSAISVLGQGTVTFNNSPSALGGVGAPVFDVDGVTRLEGSGFVAELWAGPDANSLQPWGAQAPFRTGAGAGFWNPGANSTRIIGNVTPGAPAVVEIRVWEFFWIPTHGSKHGRSNLITIPATGGAGIPPALPAPLTGLTSFHLVPEPSSFALLVVGAAALYLCPRKIRR